MLNSPLQEGFDGYAYTLIAYYPQFVRMEGADKNRVHLIKHTYQETKAYVHSYWDNYPLEWSNGHGFR